MAQNVNAIQQLQQFVMQQVVQPVRMLIPLEFVCAAMTQHVLMQPLLVIPWQVPQFALHAQLQLEAQVMRKARELVRLHL